MDTRFAVALSLAVLSLAGCLGAGDGASFMTANEAVDAVLAAAPDAAFAGVYGSEGASLEPPEPAGQRLPFVDDGRDDGFRGDGRLSSWVVSYVQGERWIERRAFADGSLGEPVERDLPEFMGSQRAYRDAVARVDSPEVARAARADECTSSRPAVPGFLYAYSLYNESPMKGHGFHDDAIADPPSVPFDRFGLPTTPATWVVVVVDMAPAGKHEAATLRLDAGGVPYGCEPGRPLQRIIRYDFDSYRDGGDGDLGISIPWDDAFHVGERVEHVRLRLQVQNGGITDDANAVLRMGDGQILHDGNAWFLQQMDLDVPAGGTWTIEVTPPEPEPALGMNEVFALSQEAYIQLIVYSYENLGP